MLRQTRRRLLATGAATLLAAGRPSFAAAASGLGDIAAGKGLLFGSYARRRLLLKDNAYVAMMKREIKLASCFSMQWPLVSPEVGEMRFESGDDEVNWAADSGIKCSGGFLIWDKVPKWFGEIQTRAEAVRAVQDHINETCTHFGKRVQLWQVGCEAINPQDERPDRLERNLLLDKIGTDYLDVAFHAAREAAPHATLLYNDTHLEYDLPDQQMRREGVLNLLDGLLGRGVPIDAVGMQGHLYTAFNQHFDERILENFINELAARNLKIVITELDVADKGSPADITLRDADVAATYKRYLDVVLANPKVGTLIMWCLSDKDSWIVRGDLRAHVRDDGLTPRPMPFDDKYRPKPAYDAIAQALAAAPMRAPGAAALALP